MSDVKLTHPDMDRAVAQSFKIVEDSLRLVPEMYPMRFFTGAIGAVRTLKHNAPWVPDEVYFQPWDLTTVVRATEAARKGWSDTQINYETTVADVPCTAFLFKFVAVDQDRKRTAVNTSTGDTDPDVNPLGVPSAGVGNPDGTVQGSGADQVGGGRSSF